jgi:ABC-type glutathione transport system ATPase component
VAEPSVAAVADGVVVQSATGQRILDGASVILRGGEVTCLVGPSGAGKTTLALLFAGFLPGGLQMTSGTVAVGGQTVRLGDNAALRALRGRQVACVFQDPEASLNPFRRCGPQAEDGLRIHRLARGRQGTEQVLRHFERMGLEDSERIYQAFPREISGGQRQRVLIAMASLLGPRLLIADEPTASLDPTSASIALGLLRALARETGTAILLVSHDLEAVAAYADRAYQVDQGAARPISVNAPRKVGTLGPDTKTTRAGPPTLEIRGLSAGYAGPTGWTGLKDSRQVLFRDVSLNLAPGEGVGIVGPSGIGKSTLGRCIGGLVEPIAGDILIDGQPVEARGLRPHDGRVQMVYQSPAASLDSRMTVAQILKEALEAGQVPESQWAAEVGRLLEMVRLPLDTAGKRATMLSGGESQRVAIARALARRPRVIVADEPTAALDEANKHVVLDLLTENARAAQMALVLITHERKLAERYVPRILEMRDGRLSRGSEQTAAVG